MREIAKDFCKENDSSLEIFGETRRKECLLLEIFRYINLLDQIYKYIGLSAWSEEYKQLLLNSFNVVPFPVNWII